MIEKLEKQDLNCNIFSVYNYDGLTMNELLCQFFTKINECVDTSNKAFDLMTWLKEQGLKEEVAKKLNELILDGTIKNLINEELFNDLNSKINNYKSQMDTELSVLKKYSIILSSFTGETNYQKLVNAISFLKSNGGGEILIDNEIILENIVYVENDINLVGVSKNAKIKRNFNKDISGVCLVMKNNTSLENIIFDGNSDNIVVKGEDFIYYEDITTDIDTDNVLIKNCHFYNSCGSFITSSSTNLIVENCTFGEYYDHCVYVGGRSWQDSQYIKCENIKIQNCEIIATTSTRSAFKIRNGVRNYYLKNNIMTNQKARFIEIDIAKGTGSVASLRANKNIYIMDNIVHCSTFISSLTELNSESYNENIFIRGNNITTYNTSFMLGDFTQQGWQYGTQIKNMIVENNIIRQNVSKNVITYNGMLGKVLEITFRDNTIIYNNNIFAYTMGDTTRIILSNNILVNEITTGSGDNSLFSPTPNEHMNYKSVNKGIWIIDKNTFIGKIYQIYGENISNKTDLSTVSLNNDMIITNNILKSDYNFIGVNVINDSNNIIKCRCVYTGNTIETSGEKFQMQYPMNYRIYDKIYYKVDSNASDVAQLKTDFNDLLNRMRIANIINTQ